jgi:hypothetical protein
VNGARQLARDFIAPLMINGTRVLDVCCGDRWVEKEFTKILGNSGHYEGMDKKDHDDLTIEFEKWPTSITDCDTTGDDEDGWDLILSIYGLQHLLAEEARVWTLLRRIARPTTRFAYVGRPALMSWREMDRQDPLNAYSQAGFRGLALASGWSVLSWREFLYSSDGYDEAKDLHVTNGNPNAFAALMEPLE